VNVKPLVSIHIITYNQLDFIHETLSSALEQDYENLEVVVADDGSTDGTAEIILEYAERYQGRLIPLVGGPNLGITGNSNRGLKSCKGKYIAFQGGDDVFLPGKTSAQVAWMEEDDKRVLCGHQVEVFYEDGKAPHGQSRPMVGGAGSGLFVKKGVPFQGTSIMIRKEAMPKYGFDKQLKTYSDDLFFIETLVSGGKYGYIDGVFARYRRHEFNVSGYDSYPSMCAEWIKMFDIIRLRYSHLKKEVNSGYVFRVLYSEALYLMYKREFKPAFKSLVTILKREPFFLKAYVRFIQCLWLCIRKG